MRYFLFFLVLPLYLFTYLIFSNLPPQKNSDNIIKTIANSNSSEYTNRSDLNFQIPEYSYRSEKIISGIKNQEYDITYSKELSHYQSPNRVSNIRFVYHNNGFTAKTRDTLIPLSDNNEKNINTMERKFKKIPQWEVKLELNDIYRNDYEDTENKFDKLIDDKLIVEKNTAYIENENIRLEYINSEKGMRQDFILKKRPNGSGTLKLQLNTETDLDVSIESSKVVFADNSGEEKMEYSSLKVWDATGRELNSKFENDLILDSKNNFSKSFVIAINDQEAVYPVTVDPTTSSNWSAESNQIGAAFGFSVSSAGDVNNDGYSDVIIGSPFYDNGQINEGKAFLFLGSANGLLPNASWTAESNQEYAQFGYSVSSAGDVNNDGFSDIIVGADSYSNDQLYEGRAYLYFGSPTGPSLIPNKILESNKANAKFGYSVSSAGDVNNDGFDDLIIGAPLFTNGQEIEGRIFLYLGSPTGPSSTANNYCEVNQAFSYFGNSVSCAGDINNDGFDDIIVGSNGYDNPQRDQGCSFVFYGSSTGIAQQPDWKNNTNLAWFSYNGYSVCGAGDVNGDGYDDVITGATGFDNGLIGDAGKIYLYYGSDSGLAMNPDWTNVSYQADARFGNNVKSAGDVNNDGYDDVLASSYLYDNGQMDEGKVFLYFGSPNGLGDQPVWSSESDQDLAYFGHSVDNAGDVNGDGFSDIIVGSYTYDNSEIDEGKVFVFYGGTINPKILNLELFIQGHYNNLSNSMASDSVTVKIRSSVPPFNILDANSSLINSSGSGIFTFPNTTLVNGMNYYIVVEGRNLISTWSSLPVSFNNNNMVYSFKNAKSKAFGNNLKEVNSNPLTFAVYNGDIDRDGLIVLNDVVGVNNALTSFIVGVSPEDLNGNQIVDLADVILVSNNASKFVKVVAP